MDTAKATGFCCPVEVKPSGGKGLGVFSKAAIKRGDIVWRHVPGLYTVYDEMGFKKAIKHLSDEEVRYELTHVFGLEDFPECLIRVFDDGVLINHARDANVETNNATPMTKPVYPASPHYVQDVTKMLLDDRYALVATRDIQAGEELTNNYETETHEPEFYHVLYEKYGVEEDYLQDDPG
ncbi:SET domain-containing protein [Roseovarius sp. 2305UL8-3]|uniref:SET domain-containing protein n=1 Tax=Roseovarius conchicola TaxID=3121636 RepID=UPI003527E840